MRTEFPWHPAAVIHDLAMAPSLAAPFGKRIQGDAIGHLVTHLIHERLHQSLILLPDAHADERHRRIFLLHFGEMRDAYLARAAPGRPELDDIGLAVLEFLDGLSLHERLYLDLGRRVADLQGLRRHAGNGHSEHKSGKRGNATESHHSLAPVKRMVWQSRGPAQQSCQELNILDLRPIEIPVGHNLVGRRHRRLQIERVSLDFQPIIKLEHGGQPCRSQSPACLCS